MDKAYKSSDNNPKDVNLEDGALVLEQLENVFFDDHHHGEMPPPSIVMANANEDSSNKSFMFSFIFTVTSGSDSSSTTTWRLARKSRWCKEEGKIDRS